LQASLRPADCPRNRATGGASAQGQRNNIAPLSRARRAYAEHHSAIKRNGAKIGDCIVFTARSAALWAAFFPNLQMFVRGSTRLQMAGLL
jgi:hypothetical protein